ncbi:MAG TPA: RNB domain-containing ribonuclease, partial [Actinotalea sp.]|nr:RNB domain-containing ribonuclease [Actinotalea sp.]
VCLAVSAGGRPPAWVSDAFDDLGGRMSSGAARARAVDRACTDLVEAAVLEHRVGEEFDAVVVDRGTVQVAQPAVVAHADHAEDRGARVRAKLVEADPAARAARFRVVGRT